MNAITTRIRALLAMLVLALAVSLLLVPPKAQADGFENYVELPPVYAGGTYKVEDLLGFVPDEYTQPDSDYSTITTNADGVLVLKVDSDDKGDTLRWNYKMADDVDWTMVDQPIYSPLNKRIVKKQPARIVVKNYYNDPIVFKWRHDPASKVAGKATILPGQSVTMRIRNDTYIFYTMDVKFMSQVLFIESGEVRGIRRR